MGCVRQRSPGGERLGDEKEWVGCGRAAHAGDGWDRGGESWWERKSNYEDLLTDKEKKKNAGSSGFKVERVL